MSEPAPPATPTTGPAVELEQERLEAVTSHRMQSPLANNTEHCTAESEHVNHEQPTWSGAWPKYPAV